MFYDAVEPLIMDTLNKGHLCVIGPGFVSSRQGLYMCYDAVEPLIMDTLNKGHLCVKDTWSRVRVV